MKKDVKEVINSIQEKHELPIISEILNYAPSSGEIVISDKSLKVIDTLEIEY